MEQIADNGSKSQVSIRIKVNTMVMKVDFKEDGKFTKIFLSGSIDEESESPPQPARKRTRKRQISFWDIRVERFIIIFKDSKILEYSPA